MITQLDTPDEEEFDYHFGNDLHFIVIQSSDSLKTYIESDQELWILNDQIIQDFITNKTETVLKSVDGIDLTISQEIQNQIVDILKLHDWPGTKISTEFDEF